MKLKCKVGDVAIFMSATSFQYTGQVVEVLGPQRAAGNVRLKGLPHIRHVKTLRGHQSLHRLYSTADEVQAVEGPAPDFRFVPASGMPDVNGIFAHLGIGKLAEVRPSPSKNAPVKLALGAVTSPLSFVIACNPEQQP